MHPHLKRYRLHYEKVSQLNKYVLELYLFEIIIYIIKLFIATISNQVHCNGLWHFWDWKTLWPNIQQQQSPATHQNIFH